MSKSSNVKKSAQLGMPHGTAANRLRKLIMLHLLQKLGEDVCYRCGERIANVRSLSIEHKEPWLDVNPALFWDLDNIAFSHLSCNCKAIGRDKRVAAGKLGAAVTGYKRYEGPSGTAWCSGCKDFLPVSQFSKNKLHWNGWDYYCKGCRAAQKQARR